MLYLDYYLNKNITKTVQSKVKKCCCHSRLCDASCLSV